MNEFIKPKVTRENLNSFDKSTYDVIKYLSDLIEQEQEPTIIETLAMGYLASIDPSFNEVFKNAKISKTEKKTFPPEFTAAMEIYKSMLDKNGEENSDEARLQFQKAMLLAPDWFKDEAHQMAREMGLLPEPTECLEDGTPVFTAEQVATNLGVPVDEVLKGIKELEKLQEEEGLSGSNGYLVDASEVHKIQ
ncbi:hypothetical protein ACG904_17580 [Acinetobacter guillouiae]|uniref:hypothetical protein n=1 Tax=Acinetobacter guillouiae TaxID=106649 RepID=UPI003AF43B44